MVQIDFVMQLKKRINTSRDTQILYQPRNCAHRQELRGAIIFTNAAVLPTNVSYQSIDLPVCIDFLCIIQSVSRR